MATIAQLTERIESINAFGRKILDDNGVITDGTETTYQLMGKIADISGGGNAKEEQEKIINITTNGTTEVLPDEGKTLSKVIITTYISVNGSNTSYMVWGETLNFVDDGTGETRVAEITNDISNIKTGVYKLFINNVSYDVVVITTEEGIMITDNMYGEPLYRIGTIEGKTYIGSTFEEGTYDIRLISTNDIVDYVIYSQNHYTEASTYIYMTNGFTGGDVHISISVDNVIVFNHDVAFEGIDGYASYQGNSKNNYDVPYLGQYIEQDKMIVIQITQTNNDGVAVTKTIGGSPRLVDGYYIWGNSDLFMLPS